MRRSPTMSVSLWGPRPPPPPPRVPRLSRSARSPRPGPAEAQRFHGARRPSPLRPRGDGDTVGAGTPGGMGDPRLTHPADPGAAGLIGSQRRATPLCPPRGPPGPTSAQGQPTARGDPAVLPIPAPTGNARPAVWLPRVRCAAIFGSLRRAPLGLLIMRVRNSFGLSYIRKGRGSEAAKYTGACGSEWGGFGTGCGKGIVGTMERRTELCGRTDGRRDPRSAHRRHPMSPGRTSVSAAQRKGQCGSSRVAHSTAVPPTQPRPPTLSSAAARSPEGPRELPEGTAGMRGVPVTGRRGGAVPDPRGHSKGSAGGAVGTAWSRTAPRSPRPPRGALFFAASNSARAGVGSGESTEMSSSKNTFRLYSQETLG